VYNLIKHYLDTCAELQERSYAADCRIYTPENPNKFSNVYVGIQPVILYKLDDSMVQYYVFEK